MSATSSKTQGVEEDLSSNLRDTQEGRKTHRPSHVLDYAGGLVPRAVVRTCIDSRTGENQQELLRDVYGLTTGNYIPKTDGGGILQLALRSEGYAMEAIQDLFGPVRLLGPRNMIGVTHWGCLFALGHIYHDDSSLCEKVLHIKKDHLQVGSEQEGRIKELEASGKIKSSPLGYSIVASSFETPRSFSEELKWLIEDGIVVANEDAEIAIFAEHCATAGRRILQVTGDYYQRMDFWYMGRELNTRIMRLSDF